MLPISLLAGKLKAPSAYFEGTFNYYLWAVPEMLYELCGGARPIVAESPGWPIQVYPSLRPPNERSV